MVFPNDRPHKHKQIGATYISSQREGNIEAYRPDIVLFNIVPEILYALEPIFPRRTTEVSAWRIIASDSIW